MQVPSTADAARSHTRGVLAINLDFSTPSRLITPEGYFGAGVTLVPVFSNEGLQQCRNFKLLCKCRSNEGLVEFITQYNLPVKRATVPVSPHTATPRVTAVNAKYGRHLSIWALSRLSAGSETRVQRDFCARSFKPFSYLNEVNLTHTTSESAVRINLDFATPIAGLGRLVCQYLHFRSRNYVHGDACVNMSCRVDHQLVGTYHVVILNWAQLCQ